MLNRIKEIDSDIEVLRNKLYEMLPYAVNNTFECQECLHRDDEIVQLGKKGHLSILNISQNSSRELPLYEVCSCEISHVAFGQKEELLLGSSNGNIFRYSLNNGIAIHIQTFDPFIQMKLVNDNLYILSVHSLFCYNLQSARTKKHYTFKRTALSFEVNCSEEVVIIVSRKKLYILNLGTLKAKMKIKPQIEFKCAVISQSLLAYADGYNIKILNLQSLDIIHNKSVSSQCSVLLFSPDHSKIAGGFENGAVYIWSLVEPQRVPLVYGIIGSHPVRNLIFTNSKNLYYSTSILYKVPYSNFPRSFEIESIGPARNMMVLEDYSLIVLNTRKNGLLFYDFHTLKEKRKEFAGKKVFTCYCAFQNSIWIFENEGKTKTVLFYHYFISKEEISFAGSHSEHHRDWEVTAIAARKDNFGILFSLKNGLIKLIHESSVDSLKLKISDVSVIECFERVSQACFGDSSGNIHLCDFIEESDNESVQIRAHSSPVTSIIIPPCGLVVYSGSYAGDIAITNLQSRTVTSRIRYFNSPITQLRLIGSDLAMTTKSGVFSTWNLQALTLSSVKHGYALFELSKSNEHICFLGNTLLKMENPFEDSSEVTLFGSGNSEFIVDYLFKTYFKPAHYDKTFNSFVVLPYKINILHLCCYFDLSRHLSLILQDEPLFIASRSDFTSLSICLNKRSIVTEDMITYCIKTVKTNPNFGYFFIRILGHVNLCGSSQLAKLYKALFITLPSPSTFCEEVDNLPQIRFVKEEIDFNDFNQDTRNNRGQPVEFKKFLVKMNFETGSRESLRFLKSIEDSPDINLIACEFPSLLILHKWKSLKWVKIVREFMHSLFLLALFLYILPEISPRPYLDLMFILNLVQALYEIFQIFSLKKQFFQSLNKVMATCQCLLIFIFFLFLSEEHDVSTKVTLTVATVVAFVRGLEILSIFKETRHIFYLIKKIFISLLPFFLVFSYSLIAATTVYFTVDSEHELEFLQLLSYTYKMSIGIVFVQDTAVDDQILFIFASILNSIVMLNLLISIIADTYAEVKQNYAMIDLRKVLSMVIEVEILMYWKRQISYSCYFVCCKTKPTKPRERRSSLVEDILNTKKEIIKLRKALGNKH